MLLVSIQKAVEEAVSVVETHRKVHIGSLAHELVGRDVLEDNTQHTIDSKQEHDFWDSVDVIVRESIRTGKVGMQKENWLTATSASA